MTTYIIIIILLYLFILLMGLPFFEHIYHKIRKEKSNIPDDDTKLHAVMQIYLITFVSLHLLLLIALLKEWLN